MTPFDIIKIIYEKIPYDRAAVIASYDAWIINWALTNTMDTLFYAEEMAKNTHLSKETQFDFYYNGIPKGKRFGKWYKEDKSEESLINNICIGLSVNRTLAKRYLSLLSEKQKEEILEMEGGNNGRISNRGTN